MTPVRRRLASLALAGALLPTTALVAPATAWAGGSTADGAVSALALNPTGSRAAQVRSTLAAEFQAHDALASITASAYVRYGRTAGAAAAAQLAASRQLLSAGVGGLSTKGAAFRDALAASDAAKLAYAQGVDRYHSSARRAAAAQQAVAAARSRVVSTLAPLVPGVSTASLTTLLRQQDALDAAAAQALGARSPSVYAAVQAAHLGTAPLARTVAVALDTANGWSGSATSQAAELRATAVNLAQAHVVQTGLATDAALAYGLSSAQYRGAKAALDTNTLAWTAAVRTLSGTANANAFKAQWVRHINDYVRFEQGVVRGSAALRTAAAVDLGGFARDNSVQLNRVSGLPVSAIVPSVRIHVAGTQVLIRQQAAHSPAQFATAAMGTMHFAVVGDRLAAAAAARLGLTQ